MEYTDLNGYRCRLSFEPDAFTVVSRHVLVIARYKGKWLLTEHRRRGIEFPGGKAESGENLLQAAEREVYEETGAIIEELQWFAEYLVGSDPPFSKTVYTAKISAIDDIALMETNGPLFVERLEPDSTYSFLMKDDGMKVMIRQVSQDGKWED